MSNSTFVEYRTVDSKVVPTDQEGKGHTQYITVITGLTVITVITVIIVITEVTCVVAGGRRVHS